MRNVALRAILVVLTATATSAQTIEWTFQQRSVSASAPGSSQSVSAPDFARFTASAVASGQTGGFASGYQDSQLNSTSLVYLGRSQGSTTGHGTSHLKVQFTLDQSANVTLTGMLESGGLGATSLSLRALSGGGTVFSANAQWGAVTPLNESGVLAPGQYELVCDESATGPSGASTWSEYQLEIPEPWGVAFLLAALSVARRPRRLNRRHLGAVVGAGLAASAWAQPIYWTSQQRYVNASVPGNSQSRSAPDFAPFNASVSASNTMGQSASASHSSQLSSIGVFYGGRSQGSTFGTAGSGMELEFSIQDAADFALSGMLRTQGLATATLTLQQISGGSLAFGASSYYGETTPFSTTGTLTPGTYSLTFGEGGGGPGGATSTCNFQFAVAPEPATLVPWLIPLLLTRRRVLPWSRGRAGCRCRRSEAVS